MNPGPTKAFLPGIDAHQMRAREAAGIQTRQPRQVVREKLVNILVTVECQQCGGTNAWPCDAKASAKVCAYCGCTPRPRMWDPARDVLWDKEFAL